MKKNLFENKKFIFVYSSLVLLSILFVVGEIGSNMQIRGFVTPYKITLLLAGVLFLVSFFTNPKNNLNYILNALRESVKPLSFLVVMIAIYIIFDIISFTYTNNVHISMWKYVTIVSMLAILFLSILMIHSPVFKNALNWILAFISGASIVLLVYVWIYEFIFGTTIYVRRLSLLIDYNKFSMTLFFGFLSSMFLASRVIKNIKVKNITMFITTALYYSTIHLTASRRTSRMMNIIIIILFIAFLVDSYKTSGDKKKNVSFYVIGSILTYLMTVLIISSYSFITTEKILSATTGQGGEGLSVDKGTSEVLDDLHTLDKRELIWTLAINSYKDYPLKNKIIGKGSSAHFDIYNEKENSEIINMKYWKKIPENTLDPHNFILVDLLDGGIIKVLITLLMLLSIPGYLFKIRKKVPYDTLFIFLIALTVLGDISISSRYGILDNKMVWLILLMLFALYKDNNLNKEI